MWAISTMGHQREMKENGRRRKFGEKLGLSRQLQCLIYTQWIMDQKCPTVCPRVKRSQLAVILWLNPFAVKCLCFNVPYLHIPVLYGKTCYKVARFRKALKILFQIKNFVKILAFSYNYLNVFLKGNLMRNDLKTL